MIWKLRPHGGLERAGNDVPRGLEIGIAIITAAELISGVAIGFEFAAVVGSIAIAGTIAGVSYALNRTTDTGARPADSVYDINSPEVRGSVRQSDPPQRIIYGYSEVGGAVSFLDDSKPPNLYLQQLLSARRLSAVRYIKVGNFIVPFRAIGFDQIIIPIPPAAGVTDPDYSSHLRISLRRGSPDQTLDPLLSDAFPNLEDTFRQQDTATATWEFAFGANQTEYTERWGQVSIPNALVGASGAPVYDPRDPSQRYPIDWRDRDDVADAMAGWGFRREAALIQGDWLGYPDGLNLKPDRIRWDEIAKAAEFDGETIVNADGTLSMRHPLDGVVMLNQKPRTVMEAMLTANRGFCVQSRGRGWVESSRPRDVALTVHDDILLGGFRFRNDRGKRDKVNVITGRIPSVDRNNQDIDIPVLRRPDLIKQDGEELPVTVRLPFTSDHRTAQRLAWQYVEESRLPRALSCKIKIKSGGLGLEPGKCVRVDLKIYPRMNGDYSIEEIGALEDFSAVTLSLAEYDPSISTAWNASEHELPFEQPELDVS